MSGDDLGYTRQTRSEKKQSAALEGVNGAVGIRNGVQCANFLVDQNTVIFLLNGIPSSMGGALFPSGPTRFKAPRNGFCDPALSEAIRRFQQANGLKADGVVDPGGPTAARMRKLANAPHAQSGNVGREQGLIRDTADLIIAILIAADKMAGSLEGSQFRGIANELDGLLARAGGPTEIRVSGESLRAALLINLHQIHILATVVEAEVLTLKSASPLTRGDAGGLNNATLDAILNAARRARQLAFRVIDATDKSIIRALNRVAEIAGNSGGRCGPALQTLVLRTNFMISLLARPLNGGPTALTLDDPVRAARDWLSAFSAAVVCLDDGGVPLLGAARGIFDSGLSLIGLLQKFLNVGDLPSLVRT